MNWGLVCLMVAGGIGRISVIPPEIPILMVAAWTAILLHRGMGRDIPVLETTAVVYVMQLLVGPWISYRVPPDFARYQMAVPEEVYFSFAIPAICAFLIPICLARSYLPRLDQVMTFEAGRAVYHAGIFICLIGFGFLFLAPAMPPGLQFVCFLGGELRFVGALYCYFSKHRQRRWVLAIVLMITIFSSLAAATFHQLLIWGVIMLSLVLAREIRRSHISVRVAILSVAFMAVVLLESFKGSYRDALRNQPDGSVLAAIRTVISTESLEMERVLDVLRVRLNQGWIVSNVLKHIPAEAPFIYGETFRIAFTDAFIPRSLFTKQTVAGGRQNFRKMTGLYIRENTSMGVSPIGEAYANFGADVGILAMFGFGIFYASGYVFACTRAKNNVLFLLWVPIIFSQAVKAETDLAVVLNHLVKAALFTVVMFPLLHKTLLGRARKSAEAGTRRPGPPVITGPRIPGRLL